VRLAELATASALVGATAARSAKVAALADALRAAGPEDAGIAVRYLSGELRQRRTGVAHRSLTGLPTAADEPSLTVAEVDAAFEAMSLEGGSGATARRRALLHELRPTR